MKKTTKNLAISRLKASEIYLRASEKMAGESLTGLMLTVLWERRKESYAIAAHILATAD